MDAFDFRFVIQCGSFVMLYVMLGRAVNLSHDNWRKRVKYPFRSAAERKIFSRRTRLLPFVGLVEHLIRWAVWHGVEFVSHRVLAKRVERETASGILFTEKDGWVIFAVKLSPGKTAEFVMRKEDFDDLDPQLLALRVRRMMLENACGHRVLH